MRLTQRSGTCTHSHCDRLAPPLSLLRLFEVCADAHCLSEAACIARWAREEAQLASCLPLGRLNLRCPFVLITVQIRCELVRPHASQLLPGALAVVFLLLVFPVLLPLLVFVNLPFHAPCVMRCLLLPCRVSSKAASIRFELDSFRPQLALGCR